MFSGTGNSPARPELGALDVSSLRRRLLSGSAWSTGGQVVAAAIALLSNALLARLLTPQEFGGYLLIISLVSVGALTGCLGLNRAAVRLVAESMSLDKPSRARRAIVLVTCLGTLGALGTGFVYLLVGRYLAVDVFGAPALATVVGLTAGWMVISSMQNLFAETFRGFHEVRLATLLGGMAIGNSAGLVMRFMLLTCLVGLWFMRGQADLTTIMLIVVGTGAVAALVAARVLYAKTASLARDEAEWSGMGAREVLGVAMPLLVTNLTVFVLVQSDLWILAAFRPPQEVAIYGAASRFMAVVTMPLVVVNAVLPPVIAGLYARGENARLEATMRPIATLTVVPAVLALVAFALAGGPILGLVYGEFYSGGATVLVLLTLGKLAVVWAGSCGLALQMSGHQTLMMWISILCGLLFVAGALLVVRPFGGVGLAAVAAATVALQNLLMVLAARIKTGVWTHVLLSPGALKRLLTGSQTT